MSISILLTCEDYFPHIGGAEVCVYNLRKELRQCGYAVTVYTNTTTRTDDEQDIVRVAWGFRPLSLWKNVRTLWCLIGRHDCIHCQYSFRLAAIAGVIARMRGKPMLLTQQRKGIVPEAGSLWYYKPLIWVCQRVSMRTAAHITSTSDEITDLTAAFVARSKITNVSNGYDARLFQSDPLIPVPPEFAALPHGTKTILTVRRLVPKNGIHILVQALQAVKDAYPDFHYFAVGEGRVEGFIRELIIECGLQQHVTLLGKRSNDSLKPYYQHADLILIPSSAEARSIACIEAMGMGKPIIASRVGGLIDLLGTDSMYGALVRIYDSEACDYGPPSRLPPERLKPLSDAIIAFLRDPQSLLESAAKAAILARSQYSWESVAQQYVLLYTSLLSSHASR